MKHLYGRQLQGVLGNWRKYGNLSKTAVYPVRFLRENRVARVSVAKAPQSPLFACPAPNAAALPLKCTIAAGRFQNVLIVKPIATPLTAIFLPTNPASHSQNILPRVRDAKLCLSGVPQACLRFSLST